MPHRITCPKCRNHLQLPDSAATEVTCPVCAARLQITALKPPAPIEPSPSVDPPVTFAKKPKSRWGTRRKKRSPLTWALLGLGLLVVLGSIIVALGFIGVGPLDFYRKQKCSAYISEVNAHVQFMLILLKENEPDWQQDILQPKKKLEVLIESNTAVRRAQEQIDKRPCPYGCHDFKSRVLAFTQRLDRFTGADAKRALQLIEQDDPIAAKNLIEHCQGQLRLFALRVQDEMDILCDDLGIERPAGDSAKPGK